MQDNLSAKSGDWRKIVIVKIRNTFMLAFLLTFFWPGFWDKDDTRPMTEQMAEARAEAKCGHQIILNRELAKKLQPGDIVRYCSTLWVVRKSFEESGPRIVPIRRPGFNAAIFIDSDYDLESRHFKGIYKKDTPEWSAILQEFALQQLDNKYD